MTSTHALKTSPETRAWWREPYVWLVIGGPAVVVVAAIATAIIAMTNPDPVLDRSVAPTRAATPKDAFTHAPAGQARNHATTATVPVKP
jgi:hypothetical protein